MNNIPVVKPGIVAVSRGGFSPSLAETRREAVVAAYRAKGKEIYDCPVLVDNETSMLKAVEDVKNGGCNALVVFLGNFGPEASETMLAEYFPGPVMYVAGEEETTDKLSDGNGRGDALVPASGL